jgi:hypothetical protein
MENEDNPASPMKKKEEGDSPTSGKRGGDM